MLPGMSGPTKVTDNRRPIVEPGGFVWPWSNGGRDLDIGQSAMAPAITPTTPTIEVGPEKQERPPRQKPAQTNEPAPARLAARRPGVLNGLAPPIIALIAVFHASPHIGDLTGLGDLLFDLLAGLPFGGLLAPAARAWSFEPFWVWAVALALRVLAMNAAKTSIMGALGLALTAFLLEAGAWIIMGPDGAAQGPLATLLLVEGALLMVPLLLLWLFERQRRQQEV